MMTIQNASAYVASQWDWAVLDGCFGNTKIKPTDLDGFVERFGRFLILETKLPDVPIKDGQAITFRSLVETGLGTVIQIWGRPGRPMEMRLVTRQKASIIPNPSLATLQQEVRKWFALANRADNRNGTAPGVIIIADYIRKSYTAEEIGQLVGMLTQI